MEIIPENSYEIRVACAEDRQEIIDFLYKFFYESEPINKYLRKTYGKYEGNKKLRTFSDEELLAPTIVAVYNNHIIGICLNRILYRGQDETDLYTSDNVVRQKLFDFLKYVEDTSKYFDYFPGCNTGLNVDIVAVDEDFKRQEITKNLLMKTR